MPRKYNRSSSVRAIREALGLTQLQIAQQLGISESHLQKIELGQKTVSGTLATVFALLYGVDPESLARGKTQPKFFWAATAPKLSVNDNIVAWREFSRLIEQGSEEVLDGFVLPKVRLLMKVAVSKNRGMAVLNALDQAVMKIAEDFELEPEIKLLTKEAATDTAVPEWAPVLRHQANMLCVRVLPGLEVRVEMKSDLGNTAT